MKLIFTSKELERIVYEGFKTLYPDIEFCALDVGFDIDEGQTKITVTANYGSSNDSSEKRSVPYSERLEAEKEKESSRRKKVQELFDDEEDEEVDSKKQEQTFNLFGSVETPF